MLRASAALLLAGAASAGAATPSPTSSTPAPTQQSVSGDPFTSFAGKKTQFYLPAGELKQLLACGELELLGRARNSGVPGDDQQWFDMFQLRAGGARSLTVAVLNATHFLPSDAADARAEAVEESDDLKVVHAAALRAALARVRVAAATSGARTLTTLGVRTEGGAVPATGAFGAGSGVNVTVAQDGSREIGTGYTEIVDVQTQHIDIKIESSIAGKFASAVDRIRNAHVDISFTRLGNMSCLTGMLPEIWGMKPMSSSTAKVLIPPPRTVKSSDK